MAISSRLSVAIHILALLEVNKGTRMTSEFIASSVNTNAVVVRRIMGMLNKAGLVTTNPGVAGASLTRPISQITLLDVYRAVEGEGCDHLFSIHEKPNPKCLVGRNIQGALESKYSQAQSAMENELQKITMDQVVMDILKDAQAAPSN
ncbi:Rrf2 family transcriptional regulator [Paenibacillus sediminis]|uniref:DNA-binding IscR family transcriptional regulator n=1 Tax=Paenibacillus sediminis TaxID=664909 RepID=A0ABS4H3B2_9BACL|nr:Rrf2 family transcriptional regulator [Paenibacillus sediminis]MBP1936772.1 DNA-binding IscR family transcriptional regulator [Paenibacillus sediminis]